MKDSDINLLIVDYYLKIRDEEDTMRVYIMIPKIVDKYYRTELMRKSKNDKNIKGYYLCGGYLKVKVKEHPAQDKRGYVLFHRLVMEHELNRYLLEDEYIHHKDGNKLNNNIENLELMYGYEHAKEHNNTRERNKFGQFVCNDKYLNNIKIRL